MTVHEHPLKRSIGLTWFAKKQFGQVVVLDHQSGRVSAYRTQELSSPEQLQSFLQEQFPAKAKTRVPTMLTIGLDGSQIGFYEFEVPSLPDQQQTAVVLTQAEGYLPVPRAQMRLAWKLEPKGASVRCLMAAVRSSVYQSMAACGPKVPLCGIVPDAVGWVRVWRDLYQDARESAVLLCMAPHEVLIIRVESGEVDHAVHIDLDPQQDSEGLQTGDILQSLHGLIADVSRPHLHVFNLGSSLEARIFERLAEEELDSVSAGPDPAKLRRLGIPESFLSAACPQSLGLALATMEEHPADLDFTRAQEMFSEAPSRGLFSASILRMTATIFFAGLLLLAGLYWKDRTELNLVRRQLTASQSSQSARELLDRMNYRTQVAQSRPDLLDLLDQIRQAKPEQILLNKFSFELGRSVEIQAQGDSYERVYEFQKNLQKQSGIPYVQLVQPTYDEKSKKVNFTVRFAYRNFSR